MATILQLKVAKRRLFKKVSLERWRKDYVIGMEITTVIKIAVDNAILELCDSCDFFAGPLLKRKNNII